MMLKNNFSIMAKVLCLLSYFSLLNTVSAMLVRCRLAKKCFIGPPTKGASPNSMPTTMAKTILRSLIWGC